MAAALLGAVHVDAKAVVAHFMMSNCYSYGTTEWQQDIQAAQSAGIDGFALNVAANPDSTTVCLQRSTIGTQSLMTNRTNN